MPARSLTSVDLPAPFSPTMATTEPAGSSRSTSSSTSRLDPGRLNETLRSATPAVSRSGGRSVARSFDRPPTVRAKADASPLGQRSRRSRSRWPPHRCRRVNRAPAATTTNTSAARAVPLPEAVALIATMNATANTDQAPTGSTPTARERAASSSRMYATSWRALSAIASVAPADPEFLRRRRLRHRARTGGAPSLRFDAIDSHTSCLGLASSGCGPYRRDRRQAEQQHPRLASARARPARRRDA